MIAPGRPQSSWKREEDNEEPGRETENRVQRQTIRRINRCLGRLRRAAIVARRRALENSGGVTIFRDGEMVWETDPKRIFPPGVEVKMCECGRVLEVKDTLDGESVVK